MGKQKTQDSQPTITKEEPSKQTIVLTNPKEKTTKAEKSKSCC
jgi:hypothetical protein